jgi:hypothetical protein
MTSKFCNLWFTVNSSIAPMAGKDTLHEVNSTWGPEARRVVGKDSEKGATWDSVRTQG